MSYRKHIFFYDDVGHVVTEFLPTVPWAGRYNTIPCAAGHHIMVRMIHLQLRHSFVTSHRQQPPKGNGFAFTAAGSAVSSVSVVKI